MGFAAWVWWVQVLCQICQPTPTLHLSQETHGSQPLSQPPSQPLIAQSLFFFAHALTLTLSLPCALALAPAPSLTPPPPPLPLHAPLSPSAPPSHTMTLACAASRYVPPPLSLPLCHS